MEYEVLGDAEGGPTVTLDHERFAYAGKFVMTNTGKVLARADGEIVGAVSFSGDRDHPGRAWLRYVSVRHDYRGEGVGPRVAAVATDRLHATGFEVVRIGVNNPFAFHAMYRAGFGWTGETTGIAELVLTHPDARGDDRYREGLDRFTDRDDLTAAEQEFIRNHRTRGVPPVVDPLD